MTKFEESMFCYDNGKPFPRTNKFDINLYNKILNEKVELSKEYREEENKGNGEYSYCDCTFNYIDLYY